MTVTVQDFAIERDPRSYGRVAVLMGGWSREREVSLVSGNAVLAALRDIGIDAYPFDVTRASVGALVTDRPDRAFHVVHGVGGEDGVLQGYLDALRIPYTGAGVGASALAMDKLRSKQLCAAVGVQTPPFVHVTSSEAAVAAYHQLGGGVVAVKPVADGSSIGISKVSTAAAMPQAYANAAGDSGVLVERWVAGRELTATWLVDRVLPIIELNVADDFYTYDAKYHSSQTRMLCPAPLDPPLQQAVATMVATVCHTIGVRDWARVDLICDQHQQLWLLECNTIPGLTSHSLVPAAAAAADISFADLVAILLTCTLRRQG